MNCRGKFFIGEKGGFFEGRRCWKSLECTTLDDDADGVLDLTQCMKEEKAVVETTQERLKNIHLKRVDEYNAKIAQDRKEKNPAAAQEAKSYQEKISTLNTFIVNNRDAIRSANIDGKKDFFRKALTPLFKGTSEPDNAFVAEYLEFFLTKIKAEPMVYDKDFCTNRKGGKSGMVQRAYENIFFDDLPKKATGDFYVPEKNKETGEIFANPGNLRGVLKNCEENSVITLAGGNYEGPIFSNIKGITLQAKDKKNSPKIVYSSARSNIKIDKKNTGRENEVDAGSALTLAGENAKIIGIHFDTPHVFTALKLKGHNSAAKNCVFSNVVTGIHSEGIGNDLTENTITQYSKDGIIYGLYHRESGGDVINNTVNGFVGKSKNAHNDGMQFYVARLNEDGSIDYSSRFSGKNKAKTVTVKGNTIHGDQGMVLLNAQIEKPIIAKNTIYATNPVHGMTLSGVIDKTGIKGNKIYIKKKLVEVNYISATKGSTK